MCRNRRKDLGMHKEDCPYLDYNYPLSGLTCDGTFSGGCKKGQDKDRDGNLSCCCWLDEEAAIIAKADTSRNKVREGKEEK